MQEPASYSDRRGLPLAAVIISRRLIMHSFPDVSRFLDTFKAAAANAMKMKAEESAISFPGQILQEIED